MPIRTLGVDLLLSVRFGWTGHRISKPTTNITEETDMEKRNGLARLALALFGLVVGTGLAVMAAENEVAGLVDHGPSQIVPAEKATADIKKMAAPISAKKQTRQVTGSVIAISGDHLNVKKGNKTFALKVEEGIVIKSSGLEKSLADLKVGDKIMAKYVEKSGVLIARSIHLKNDIGK